MIKELKYLLFLSIIFLFIFLNLNYYFSDNNKKKAYRSLKENNEKIDNFSQNIILLENNTDNVVEYVKKDKKKNKKDYNFWKLINNNE
tara:strand:- start:211 stop:474 length:264 start_codon:yes stop_codon:yes gene_type:complete